MKDYADKSYLHDLDRLYWRDIATTVGFAVGFWLVYVLAVCLTEDAPDVSQHVAVYQEMTKDCR